MPPAPGSALRDHIAHLLKIKFHNVIVEHRLVATTADVFYIDDTNPIFPQRIAVEAKDWGRALTSDKIAKIDNLYRPSLSSGEIDYLLIVGRHPLASSPQASVSKLQKVKFCTAREFDSSLMNFRSIVQQNVLAFTHHAAAANFIETRARDSGEPMDSAVRKWINSKQIALVVFGGYGIGKTTYSLHLAKTFSEEYISGKSNRIPIRISLGGMYTKQDLPALICSTLTGNETGASVQNFSYHLFLEMNRNGQFILVLDGFDEMRHAMELDDFVYTFEQMKPLFSGKAKVILLGRPDSFLSNHEEEKVLSKMFDLDMTGKNQVQKVEVAFFSSAEIETYVTTYLKNKRISLSEVQAENFHKALGKLPDDENNILSRPVQLRMFTEIMDESLLDGIELTRYQIYQKFIYRFWARESQKPARQGSSASDSRHSLKAERAIFMQDVAWWILSVKKENRFLASEVPLNLIPSKLKENGTKDSALREALVGSVIEPISKCGILDSKANRYYYFPHKSYIEFLVTEHFIRNRFTVHEFGDFLAVINNEILSFIEERDACVKDDETGISKLRQGLSHVVGNIDARIVRVCAKDRGLETEIGHPSSFISPADIYTHYFYLRQKNDEAVPYLLKKLSSVRTVAATAAVLNCVYSELEESGSASAARLVLVYCFTTVLINRIRDFVVDGEEIRFYIEDKISLLASVLSQCIGLDGERSSLVFSLLDLGILAEKASYSSLFVPISSGKAKHAVRLPITFVNEKLDEEWTGYLKRIIEARADCYKLFPVALQGKAEERFLA